MPSTQTPGVEEEVLSTGVPGLDKLLGGGLARGAVVLLAGNPGTGKTTLASRFLLEGLRRGEPGIYVNFIEPKEDYYGHMERLGAGFREYEEKGVFRYMEALTLADEEALRGQLEEILAAASEMGARRLVVDSVTVILQILGSKKSRVRELLQNFFVNGLKRMGITTVLIAEHPYGSPVVGEGVEEFVVDAVILLRAETQRGRQTRVLELRKVRWAPVRCSEVYFRITPGSMIEVLLPEELAEIPPPDYSETYSLCGPLVRASATEPPLISLEAPYPERGEVLAELCPHLVIPRDAQVVVGLDPGLSSRFYVSVLAALEEAAGRRTLVLSMKTSSPALESASGCVASRLGAPAPAVSSFNPSGYTLSELMMRVRSRIEGVRPRIVFLEGLEMLDYLYDPGDVAQEVYNLSLWMRRRRVLGVYIYTVPSREALLQRPLVASADAWIYARPVAHRLDGSRSPLRQLWEIEVGHSLLHLTITLAVSPSSLLSFTCTPGVAPR